MGGLGGQSQPETLVSVIIPARNEEACIGHCLASVLVQHGVRYEIIVVNDGSIDRTREIVSTYTSVKLMDAGPLPPGWTGKCHALHRGYLESKGDWLLFTDADTVHRRSSLRHALREAKKHEVDMLSYSPKQEVHGPWERTLMPLVFAELRREYPPESVNDPKSLVVAANGQYILIRREAYEAVGGHEAIRHSLLEDVELARAIKVSGRKLRFRYGGDAVKTRMYRSVGQMWNGWTKNLALLFTDTLGLARNRSVEFLTWAFGFVVFLAGMSAGAWAVMLAGTLISVPVAINFFYRVRKAHFGWLNTIISPFGVPVFVILLIRSHLHFRRNQVSWKGRTYAPGDQLPREASKKTAATSK